MELYGHENPPDDPDRRMELARRLSGSISIRDFISSAGLPTTSHVGTERGYCTIEILPELCGLPLCDLVLAYMPSVHATYLRVLRPSSAETLDSCLGRVTVYVDEHDVIKRVQQEVRVAFGTGHEVYMVHCCLRGGKNPAVIPAPPDCIGNLNAISKVDFS